MKETILTRYKVRQEILRLVSKLNDLKNAESQLDDMITYKALQLDDPAEAERFKRLHIDNRREGLFRLRVKNGLKIDVPTIK